MLKSLTIRNYAIVDSLTIDFDKGFNVFVGETGAGKSIIVSALSLLTRGRSDTAVIKNGKDKAIIEGVFEIDDQNIIAKLNEQDIECDNNEVIVKRVISSDNHNSIKINESSVTLNFLEDLFGNNVDIHSQKDNHYLYNKKNQLTLLDKYANDSNFLKDYQYKYVEYKRLEKEYNELLNGELNETQLEIYRYDLEEIENANISVDDENELEANEKRYKSAEKYINILKECLGIYNNDNGIKEKLYNVNSVLNIDDEDIKNISSKISDLYYELDDEFEKLQTIFESFSESNLNIEEIEERLYIYSKLKRKHKTDAEGLIRLKEDLTNKIDLYNDRDKVLQDKKKELDKAYKDAIEAAEYLSKVRLASSEKLKEQIERNAADLLLNNFRFEIRFNKTELGNSGIDDIEFYVSTNKGEETKPLKNIASGGEISRLLLGLKTIFSKLSNTELLILDEIDTGVSGKVASAIGQKIKAIAKDVQVITITHLAPVAACSTSQYLIYKTDNETNTLTNVKKLNNEEFIEQLAIISNTSTDSAAIEAARQLYENSQKATK